MGFLSFGKKRGNGSKKDVGQNQIMIKEEKAILQRRVLEMTDGLLKPYSAESIQRKIKLQIDKKRFANPSKDDYKYSLLRNIIYFLEVEKEIKRTITNLLRGDKFESLPALDQHILQFQSRIRNSMDDLLTHNHDKFYHKYLASEQGINGLEREFIDRSVMHSWYIDVSFYLQSDEEWTITGEIPKRWVVSEIERTLMWKLSEYLYLHNDYK
ncbi:hypothetical protein [Jeotgalibacillus proteolyticus]|uniref:hypothetical protein n=1 Tax=Jeotgalibacillus proteolyticus TaxID=2082395 RepID=UPI003CF8AC1D